MSAKTPAMMAIATPIDQDPFLCRMMTSKGGRRGRLEPDLCAAARFYGS
jgi:hypothetical protein